MSGGLAQYMEHGWHPQAYTLTSIIVVGRRCHRSDQTTNLDRILGDLLGDVLAGLTTVQEANGAYRARPVQRGGRRPRFASFADYVDDRIRYAESPDGEGELLALLVRSARPGRGAIKSAETRRINRLLAETGRERAERLRDLLAELAEPVCAA